MEIIYTMNHVIEFFERDSKNYRNKNKRAREVSLMKKIFRSFRNMKTKLILAFSLILIIPGIIIGTESYLTAKNTVEQQVLAGATENVNLLNSIIDSTMQPKIHDIDIFSQSVTSPLYQGR